MRALVHYLVAAFLLSVYGGQVCPCIDVLAMGYWSAQVVLAFALAFTTRWLLQGLIAVRSSPTQQVCLQFFLDLGLFFATGWVLFLYNLLVWHLPWESGLKMVLGCTTLGIFVSTDLALEWQRRLSIRLAAEGRDLELKGSYLSLPGKFVLATILGGLLVTGFLLLLVAREIGWIAEQEVQPAEALKVVLIETVIVVGVFLAEAINVILSFSKNLRMAFERENRVLQEVNRGDLSCHVPVTTKDEFGEMAFRTNQMIISLSKQRQELQRTQDATILSLASLAETRDNETGGHILRTQGYVRALARHLKQHPDFADYLTDEVIDLLYKSAPLHDVGKVGVPDAILLKPARLNAQECEEMKRHTIYGRDALRKSAKVLGDTSFLSLAQEIAYTHHEKWDGSGYPGGLAGDDIPLSGRLMALADVYDALINKRVYKKAFSHQQAREIIIEGRGGHFDPRIVDAFLEQEEVFKQIAQDFHDEKFHAEKAA